MTTIARRIAVFRPENIRSAYARLARYYDFFFGPLLAPARAAAIRTINALPGREILEVGVGTGLALPKYTFEKHITGIDLSADMLKKARERAAGLSNVRAVIEMDAQSTNFSNGQFDIAVAMFVASVVPDPHALIAEMRRIVKPGGTILFVNHFARVNGPLWWRRISNALTSKLGWRADFRFEDIFTAPELAAATITPQFPFGLFQLVEMQLPI